MPEGASFKQRLKDVPAKNGIRARLEAHDVEETPQITGQEQSKKETWSFKDERCLKVFQKA